MILVKQPKALNKRLNHGKQQQGFTLIELIMVIVILGILSAFALPRFADFTGDASRSSIEGARAAVRSASAIAHAACLANANCNANAATGENVLIEGETVDMIFGYPDQDDLVGVAGLADYSVIDATTAGYVIVVSDATPADSDPCFTYANSASANALPTISERGTYAVNGAGTADDTCS